jgi:hypothetical protein
VLIATGADEAALECDAAAASDARLCGFSLSSGGGGKFGKASLGTNPSRPPGMRTFT